LLLYFNF